MKVLIISDSHYKNIRDLDLASYDYIIHAGDINKGDSNYLDSLDNVYKVRGNCDFFSNAPLDLNFTLDNKNVYLTHSHLYNSKETFSNLIAKGKDYDMVIFGHTHSLTYFYEGKTLFLNPGSYMEGSYLELIDNKLYHCYLKPSLFKKSILKKKFILEIEK